MGQNVKRKKKGRPSKADLARRAGQSAAAAAVEKQQDRRRSLRRRNVRYTNFIDYDDYLDEFEEYEEIEDDEEGEEDRRKEKKLKLVVKLHNQKTSSNKLARGGHARGEGSSSEEEGEAREKKVVTKKRKINGGYESDQAEVGSENEDDENIIDQEERKGGAGAKGRQQESMPGTPSDHQNGLPMPDKKSLELILDKLQKKDTYGVYAEPVDLEELPDYLDVIDHPMDFTTVRKKLGDCSYSTFEQFESDVFLICSNAMQYNAPESIYYKQARTIQELATKKFQKLRISIERSEKELKSEQKTKSNFVAKKQIKKPFNRTMQEPVGSDFSSGATLATAGDVQNGSVANQVGSCERSINPTDGPVDGNLSLVDSNMEKTEDLSSGKGLLSKFGRKPSGFDDNRRATYNISNHPMTRSESVFSTFESEIKQLVAVGLHVEYSYARSLARFAATLGPAAWKVASQRIEKALPPGCKFGRGWVGEYEPLATPVLMLESRAPKESTVFTRFPCPANERKGDATPRAPGPAMETPIRGPSQEGKSSLFHPTGVPTLEGKPSLFPSSGTKPSTSVNPTYQQQNLLPRKFAEKLVELNLPPSSRQQDTAIVAKKQLPHNSEMAAPKPREIPRTIGLAQSVPSKQPNSNEVFSGRLPNGKVTSSSLSNLMISSSSDGVPNQIARAATYFPKGKDHGLTDPVEAMRMSTEKETMRVSAEKEAMRMSAEKEARRVSVETEAMRVSAEKEAMRMSAEKGAARVSAEKEAMRMSAEKEAARVSAEKEAIRMSAEKTQKQHKSSKQTIAETPLVTPSVPSLRNDCSNAAAAAARAWMSIGAGGFKLSTETSVSPKSQISAESLYNPTRQLHPQIPQVQGQYSLPAGMRLQPEKHNVPFQAFMGQPVHMGNQLQIQRPMAFSQLAATDLSRFQMQSPRRWANPNSQQKQKQETLPPDLNIGFQPPGSPVKQSSGVMVDSQQPDLALQL